MFLTLKATLQAVSELQFKDSPDEPYVFTFTIECLSCHEIHPKPVTVTQYETNSISGSRGEANFVYRCHQCKRESSFNFKLLKTSYIDSGKPLKVVEIDPRGLMVVGFTADGLFTAKGAESPTKFDEVTLEDGEWYDYDEKTGEEVSITEVVWDFVKK